MQDPREINLAMDFSLRVGEVLLANGAGAADVTVVIRDLARHFGIRQPEIDVTFTSLSMVHQDDPEDVPLVMMRHVKQRDIDYEDLTRVDNLVRYALSDQIDLKEARQRLARIVSSGHALPRWAVTVGWAVLCGVVGLQFGGDWAVVLLAAVAASLIDRIQLHMSKRRLPQFYQQVAGGALATVLAMLAAATPLALDPSLVVTANIVMLLAGVGFMGALQDALSGFYITAGARVLEAVLATAGIIAGVSAGLTFGGLIGVDIPKLEPFRAGLDTFAVSAAAAGVVGLAFAFSSYAPRRSLLPIAGISAGAMMLYQLMLAQDTGGTWAAAVGAFAIGLVSYSVAGRIRVPPLIVVVSCVVPMLPGLAIYRGLALLAEGGARATSSGLLALFTAASVAISLASGVILGEYVAQPLKRNARKLESRLAGPRLVGGRRPE